MTPSLKILWFLRWVTSRNPVKISQSSNFSTRLAISIIWTSLRTWCTYSHKLCKATSAIGLLSGVNVISTVITLQKSCFLYSFSLLSNLLYICHCIYKNIHKKRVCMMMWISKLALCCAEISLNIPRHNRKMVNTLKKKYTTPSYTVRRPNGIIYKINQLNSLF